MYSKSIFNKYIYLLILILISIVWQNCTDSALVLPEIEEKEEVITDTGPDPIEAFQINATATQVSFGQDFTISPNIAISDVSERNLQWFHNDEPIQDATNETLVITKALPISSGSYKLQVDDFTSPEITIEVHQAKNCAAVLSITPGSPSGIYVIDPDEAGPQPQINAECDMTTDGGGWTLVLNYLHRRDTQPPLNVKVDTLPLKGMDTLGLDESSDLTKWGHASISMMAKMDYSETLFACSTNSSTARRIHFKTNDAACKTYFQTGVGFCSAQNGVTNLAGHNARTPGTANMFREDLNNLAMTEFPFYEGATAHWGVRAISPPGTPPRWECDNYTAGANPDTTGDTLHRIWIR